MYLSKIQALERRASPAAEKSQRKGQKEERAKDGELGRSQMIIALYVI